MNTIENASILVVGGAGFVGSNLCQHLLNEGVGRIVIVDNLLSSDPSNLPVDSRVDFRHGSIADDGILQTVTDEFDYVWHLACYHGNQSSIHNPLADHENNTLTSLKLFNHLKDFRRTKKVVYAAAGCAVAEKTYDEAQATHEDAPVSLFHDSPYSISKLIGEMYANYFWARFGLPIVKTRFQNVYGPREILGAGQWRGTRHTVWRNVVPTFIWNSLAHMALPLENQGLASRDFIYVGDMARGLHAAALRGTPGEVYNLASGVETSIRQLADVINELTANPAGIELLPARDWDRSGHRFGSTSKAAKELGFTAKVDLRTGLAMTIEWTIANAETIRKAMQSHADQLQLIGEHL
jgi:UDP-glucose 4-epimerase